MASPNYSFPARSQEPPGQPLAPPSSHTALRAWGQPAGGGVRGEDAPLRSSQTPCANETSERTQPVLFSPKSRRPTMSGGNQSHPEREVPGEERGWDGPASLRRPQPGVGGGGPVQRGSRGCCPTPRNGNRHPKTGTAIGNGHHHPESGAAIGNGHHHPETGVQHLRAAQDQGCTRQGEMWGRF